MSYHSVLLDAAYRQIERHGWSLERLHSKAKAIVAAGTAALSVITVGLSGFATLLAGADLDHMALLESLFGWLAHTMVAVAVAGIAAVIASMIVSILALKGCKLHQILGSDELEYAPKKEPPGDQEDPHKPSEDGLRQILLERCRLAIKTLEECNGKVAPRVLWGQILLVAGIVLISTIPLAASAKLLFL